MTISSTVSTPSLDAFDPASLPNGRFVVLLAMDATDVDSSALKSFAAALLSAGAVYFCCWGPDCERVHDCIDAAVLDSGIESDDDDTVVLTTWHNDEPLGEAAYFTCVTAMPHENLAEDWSVIGIAVGNDGWADQIDGVLANPDAWLDAHPD